MPGVDPTKRYQIRATREVTVAAFDSFAEAQAFFSTPTGGRSVSDFRFAIGDEVAPRGDAHRVTYRWRTTSGLNRYLLGRDDGTEVGPYSEEALRPLPEPEFQVGHVYRYGGATNSLWRYEVVDIRGETAIGYYYNKNRSAEEASAWSVTSNLRSYYIDITDEEK